MPTVLPAIGVPDFVVFEGSILCVPDINGSRDGQSVPVLGRLAGPIEAVSSRLLRTSRPLAAAPKMPAVG